MTSARVALDAMGGDDAPAATVAGAVQAARDYGVEVTLVGQHAALQSRLEAAGADGLVEVVDAPDVIAMDEDPVGALRAKPQSSIRVACQLVVDGVAGALVSAGSTGATLTAGLLGLGRVPGIRRPVVAAVLPLAQGRRVVLLDAGGSTDVHPEVFAGYALMGTAYAEVLGATDPTVGLLNIGEEPGKGSELAKAVFELLEGTQGFVGNVEPEAVLSAAADVVLTDGFTGNIFLKTVEALAPLDDREADTSAVVLGIRGEVLVAHGGASADDICKALQRATQVATAGLASVVAQRLAEKETA